MGKPMTSLMPQQPEFLRLPQVLAWTGLGRSTLYRLVARESFPRPVKLSPRAVGWRRQDVEAWGMERPISSLRDADSACRTGH